LIKVRYFAGGIQILRHFIGAGQRRHSATHLTIDNGHAAFGLIFVLKNWCLTKKSKCIWIKELIIQLIYKADNFSTFLVPKQHQGKDVEIN